MGFKNTLSPLALMTIIHLYTVISETIHNSDRPFYCEECGSNFAVEKYLVQHIKYKHGDVETNCIICDQSFKGKSFTDV